MNSSLSLPRILSALCLLGVLAASLAGQTQPAVSDDSASVADLRERLEQAFAVSALEELDLLAPRQYNRACDSRDTARKLIEDNREENLIRLTLLRALDELEAARRTAAAARQTFGDALIERDAAFDARADSLSPASWKRAEDLLHSALRKSEQRGPAAAAHDDDIIGTYRAARLEAIRSTILDPARHLIEQAERRGAEKQFPGLLMRATQAIGRAEAALAQGKTDEAQVEAETAAATARRMQALLALVEAAQRSKTPWEAALLPYEDLLDELAAALHGELDSGTCGVAHHERLFALLDARFDSLQTRAADQQIMLTELESSLADAQTGLADAQNRIRELENRVVTVEDQRASARVALQTQAETADRIARAQDAFKPGEAVVLPSPDGTIIVRLQGLQFAAGASALTKAHRSLLDHAMVALAQFPGAKLRVEGHTDTGGGADANQKLSETRAQQVADYLTQKMKKPAGEIESVGFGESRPLVANDGAENRQRNRRIDLVLVLP
ncbi:MAG: OmpA family protein [bacterium]|nr:OmpA family protein [bacterium]